MSGDWIGDVKAALAAAKAAMAVADAALVRMTPEADGPLGGVSIAPDPTFAQIMSHPPEERMALIVARTRALDERYPRTGQLREDLQFLVDLGAHADGVAQRLLMQQRAAEPPRIIAPDLLRRNGHVR